MDFIIPDKFKKFNFDPDIKNLKIPFIVTLNSIPIKHKYPK